MTNRKDLIKHHAETHSSKHHYVCSVCNAGFTSLSGKAKHIQKNHKDKSLLETSNQKTISNNDNLNACQGNNQYNVFGLQCDTTLEIKKELNEDDAIFDLQQELSEEDTGLLSGFNYDEIVSNYVD